MVQRQRANGSLYRASCPKGMGKQWLHRTYRNRIGVFAEHPFDGERFGFVIEWRRTPMGVNIANHGWGDTCLMQRQAHRTCGWFAMGMRGSHVMSVIRQTIAKNFPQNGCPAGTGMLQLLQH